LQILSWEFKKPKEVKGCSGKPFFEAYLSASYLWANTGRKNIGGPMLGLRFIFGGKRTIPGEER
ncbi:MAG: hypothetical protein QME40_06875, partial [bacterium]|nr:hypothetical protein [bacterium]